MKLTILLCLLMSACTKIVAHKKAPAPSITTMPVEAETVEAKNAEL